MKWFVKCLRNYANFRGRASRSEFWWFLLILSVLVVGLSLALFYFHIEDRPLLVTGFLLLLLLPYFAVAVRRLHDMGRSGWWAGGYLAFALSVRVIDGFSRGVGVGAWWADAEPAVVIVQGVFGILLLYWLSLRGDEESNKYGAAPKME